MGDMKEYFDIMQESKKERHQEWYHNNLDILNKSNFQFEHKDTVCLFRIKDKPKADFYPHTGRWRSENKTHRGGAKSFLAWYSKQRIEK